MNHLTYRWLANIDRQPYKKPIFQHQGPSAAVHFDHPTAGTW